MSRVLVEPFKGRGSIPRAGAMIKLINFPERFGAQEADVGPMELSEHLLNFYELIDTYEVPNAPNVPNVEKPTQLLEVAKLIRDVLIPFAIQPTSSE